MIASLLMSFQAAHGATIVGIEDLPGGGPGWVAHHVPSGTRTHLGAFAGVVDPAENGDLAWIEGDRALRWYPSSTNGELYSLDLSTTVSTFLGPTFSGLDVLAQDLYALWGYDLDSAIPTYHNINRFTGAILSTQLAPIGAVGAATKGGSAVIIDAAGLVYEFNLFLGGGSVAFVGDARLGAAPQALTSDYTTGSIYALDVDGGVWLLDPSRAMEGTLITQMGRLRAFEVIPTPSTFSRTLVAPGGCPGPSPIDIREITPGGSVLLLTASSAGLYSVPSGSCAGTLIPLRAPRVSARFTGNALGEVHVAPVLPASACGKKVMALDVASCSITNVQTL